MFKSTMFTDFGIIVICLILLRVQASEYDDFVSETLIQNCPYTGTCSRSPNLLFQFNTKKYMPCCQQCSCEKNCRSRGTCCYDSENQTHTEIYERANEKCLVPIYPGSTVPDGRNLAYFTVTSCPVDRWRDNISELCETADPQTLEQIVLVSDDKGTIYRNMYCAQCNGVSHFTHWKAEVTCNTFDSAKIQNLNLQNIMNSGCTVKSGIPDNFSIIRTSLCYVTDFTECNVTGKWKTYEPFIDSACRNWHYGIFLHLRDAVTNIYDVYKNVFCYLCNADVRLTETVCKLESVDKKFSFIPFTAIINLRQGTSQYMDTDENKGQENQMLKCGTNEIFDHYTGICRKLFCPIDSFVLGGECVKKFNAIGSLGVRFCFGYRSADQFIASKKESEDIVKELSENTTLLKRIRKQGCINCMIYWISEPSLSNMTYIAHFFIMVTDKCSINDIWKLVEEVDNSIVITKSNMTFYKYLLPKGTVDIPSIFDFLKRNDVLQHDFKDICPVSIFIILHDMICPMIKISGLDLVQGLDNGYIRNNGHYLKYNLQSYDEETLANKTFDMCLDDYLKSKDYQIGGCKSQYYCVGWVVFVSVIMINF